MANDIGVNSKGDLWVIGNTKEGGGYSIHNYRNKSQTWEIIGGSAVRIAVSPNGPWVVNKYGNIYVLDMRTKQWTAIAGCAKDIGAGADGSIWVIGCGKVGGGYTIHTLLPNSKWRLISGGATDIAVDRNGSPFVSNDGGFTYWDTKIKLTPPKPK